MKVKATLGLAMARMLTNANVPFTLDSEGGYCTFKARNVKAIEMAHTAAVRADKQIAAFERKYD